MTPNKSAFCTGKSSLRRSLSYAPRPEPLLPTVPIRSPSLIAAHFPSNCYLCDTHLPAFSPLRRLCCLCGLSTCLSDSVELCISHRPQIRCIRCHEATLTEPYDQELQRRVELMDYRLAEMEEESSGFELIQGESVDCRAELGEEEAGLRADIQELERITRELGKSIDSEEAKSLQIALETAQSARQLSEMRLSQTSKQLHQAQTLLSSSRKQNLLIAGQITELRRAVDQRIPASFLKSTLCQKCFPRFRSVLGETSLATSAHSRPRRGEEAEKCCFCLK